MEWFEFIPTDTIFFRGAEPMEMGESHTSKLNFPPPLSTIIGAVRTMILKQNKVPFRKYYSGDIDKKILEITGKFNEKAGFNLIGPYFKIDNDVYIPAPYNWYFEKKNKDNKKIEIIKSEKIDCEFIKTDKEELYWAKNVNDEVETLGGKWIKIQDISKKNGEEIEYKTNTDLFVTELRTGIALETKARNARKGHIYQFNHIRFKKGVSMIYSIDKDLPLSEKGVLQLGAEQRFGGYSKVREIIFPENKGSGLYMSLSMIEKSDQANDAVVATGKPVYLGGWDLKKGFHKPMVGYYPAGSVFNKKFNDNLIEI